MKCKMFSCIGAFFLYVQIVAKRDSRQLATMQEDNLQTLCWRCNRSKGAKI